MTAYFECLPSKFRSFGKEPAEEETRGINGNGQPETYGRTC